MSITRYGESDQHLTAKDRLESLAKLMTGYRVHVEYKGFYKELEGKGLPLWTPDVFCEPRQSDLAGLILEADGRVGHTSDAAVQKMSDRDAYFWLNHGIKTARIKVKDLVGAEKAPDVVILAEVVYQLNRK